MLQFGETGNCNLVETSYHLSLKKKKYNKNTFDSFYCLRRYFHHVQLLFSRNSRSLNISAKINTT